MTDRKPVRVEYVTDEHGKPVIFLSGGEELDAYAVCQLMELQWGEAGRPIPRVFVSDSPIYAGR